MCHHTPDLLFRRRVYEKILKPMFLEYFVEQQSLLTHQKHIENVLRLVPDEIRQNASDNWNNSNSNSMERWLSLEKTVSDYIKNVCNCLTNFTHYGSPQKRNCGRIPSTTLFSPTPTQDWILMSRSK